MLLFIPLAESFLRPLKNILEYIQKFGPRMELYWRVCLFVKTTVTLSLLQEDSWLFMCLFWLFQPSRFLAWWSNLCSSGVLLYLAPFHISGPKNVEVCVLRVHFRCWYLITNLALSLESTEFTWFYFLWSVAEFSGGFPCSCSLFIGVSLLSSTSDSIGSIFVIYYFLL